ncbi:hypothetical protein CW749_14155 [Vibrio sp. vnigr-6D03]|uniref:hypothetical protein n=1 Tax=Vibrio sp. vnigr-6D03 TaxID=2058088 RepID=UPI000C32EDF7|nr:hypothetical protein [Vibrio sp. vnigr-6D03]PKF79107.1 hypothetical protein CW749_14155 [Vibrio sp. vnigr-6D03]
MKLKNIACLAGALACSLTSAYAFAEKLTGTYVGEYHLKMNVHAAHGIGKDSDGNRTPWPESELNAEMNGQKYKVLGDTTTLGTWIWDFDNEVVTINGSTLLALGFEVVPFQAFNINELENKRSNTSREVFSLAEVQLPFQYDELSDTYTVEYAHKKYFEKETPDYKVSYPIGHTSTTFKVNVVEDGSIAINTLDVDKDNVPGTRLENVFPTIVQIEYNSENMYLDSGADGNNDGISDVISSVLNLNDKTVDFDNDGLDDATEIRWGFITFDSDADGVPNHIERGDTATEAQVLDSILLAGNTKLSIRANTTYSLNLPRVEKFDFELEQSEDIYPFDGSLPLTETNQGVALNYDLGKLRIFHSSASEFPMPGSRENLALEFNQIPEDLVIYQYVAGMKPDFSFGQGFEKLEYIKSGNNLKLSVNKSHVLPQEIILIFGTSETIPDTATEPKPEVKPDVKPDNKPNADSNNATSGASFGLWSLLLLSTGVFVRRRTLKA